MASINECIGKLEETLKVLADIDRRFGTALQRISGGEASSLVSQPVPHTAGVSDDLISRFQRQLNHFMSLNESISGTLGGFDASLGIDSGGAPTPSRLGSRPIGSQQTFRPFNPQAANKIPAAVFEDEISHVVDEGLTVANKERLR